MRSKIIIRLGPKFGIPVDLKFLKFRKGLSGLFDLVLRSSSIFVFLFLAGVLSFEYFSDNTGLSTTYAVFAFVIIVLALQLAKKLLGRGEFLPQVNFDLALLTFTTVIAASLFYSTAILRRNLNIWGGVELRMISGVMLILYWFVFYLISVHIRDRWTLRKALTTLWFAPIISIFMWLITLRDFSAPQYALLGLLAPGSLWLLLTQKRYSWLHLFNLLFSVLILILAQNNYATFTVFALAFFSFLAIGFINRNRLYLMFKGLDLAPGKFKLRDYLNNNAAVIFLILSLFTVVGGMFWISHTLTPEFFAGISAVKNISFGDLPNILLGKGLEPFQGSKLLQFVNAYGLIPLLVLITALFLIVRSMVQVYKKSNSLANRGLLLWSGTSLLSFAIYLLLTNQATETVLLYSVILGALTGTIINLTVNKKPLPVNIELREFNQKNKRLKLLFTTGRIILILLIFLAAIYLLCSLNYINILLVA